ncbi:4'-phosphopantetheinyl transferase family protein [Streptomyces sp. NPDC050421]|uniref:4'-phosphopantetheinyl transferase family protein n=1 Tax=unclassified Streptomyces TaxID=2593676 RepID=UPI00379A7C0E
MREAIGVPIEVPGPGASWGPVEAALMDRGTVAVFARWSGWLPPDCGAPGLVDRLGAHDWRRSGAMTNPAARARFVATRLLTRYTAAAALRIAPEEVDLAYRPGGRPYLRGCGHVEVALTHTGDTAAVALSRLGRVGVDMEPLDRHMSYDGVRRLLCTPAERDAVGGLPEAERSRALLRLWTLKEAYAKAMGQGMRMGFAGFGFALDGLELLARDGTPISPGEWAFGVYEVGGRHLLSVARHAAGWEPSARTGVQDLLDADFLDEVTRAQELSEPLFE